MKVTCAIGMGVAAGPLGISGVAVLPSPPNQDGKLIKESWQPVLLKANKIRRKAKLTFRIPKFKVFINPPPQSRSRFPA
jgi:hypothetical protein